MFKTLPLEIIEKILLLLNYESITSVFSAYNTDYKVLSDYFWKTVCHKEDFLQAYREQSWHQSFQCGVNKRTGSYVQTTHVPVGQLHHLHLRTLVISDLLNTNYSIYYVGENGCNLVQEIFEETVQFKDEFCMIQQGNDVKVHKLNFHSNKYELKCSICDTRIDHIFGLNVDNCASMKPGTKQVDLFNLATLSKQVIQIPSDVKFVIEKVLDHETLVFSVLTFNEGYKIKVYNISEQTWASDVVCFSCTGITNDPNIWVSRRFMACCDVSFRLRGTYFGPFKIWDRQGAMVFQTDIEPSTKHYLRCFFKDEHIILTTSDTTITVFNHYGQVVKTLQMTVPFLDVKITTGFLILVLLEGKDEIKIYDWLTGSFMYSIKLNIITQKLMCSEFLFCPLDSSGKFEIVKFY